MLERGTPSEYVSYIILTTHKKFHALDQPVTIFFPFYLTIAWADVRVGFPSALMRVVALMAFFCSIPAFCATVGRLDGI